MLSNEMHFYICIHLTVCSLVKYRVRTAKLLLKIMNEGHNISNRVCHTTAGIWPDEAKRKPDGGKKQKGHAYLDYLTF